MATNSSENDATEPTEDQAQGARLPKANDRQSLCEKINKNTALNLSWADMLDELENDGTVLNRETKTIESGAERPAEAAGAQRKDPRIVIPRDPSAYPGFPVNLGQFESAKAYGQAVILFWHEHRKSKRKEKDNAKKEADRAKKEADRLKVASHNEKVPGSDRYQSRSGRENRRDDRSKDRREDRTRQQNRGGYGKSLKPVIAATGSNAIPVSSTKKIPHNSGWDTLGFEKTNAEDVSPDLILPWGRDVEVGILREKINKLPADFLQNKEFIRDCKSGSENSEENRAFWRGVLLDPSYPPSTPN